MTLYRKSVRLRDFNIHTDLNRVGLHEGMEAAYKQLDNNETFMTLIDDSKEDINTKLAELNVMSDRVRTLSHLPKYRIINTVKKRIQ